MFKLINELIGHLIWPLVAIIFLFMFKEKIYVLFDSIKRLKYKDVEAEFDKREKSFAEKEVSPLNDEVDGLIKRIESLEKTQKLPQETSLDKDALKNIITDALENGPYKWRSIPKLASISGSTDDEIINILREDHNIVLGTGKSGRKIARMKYK